MKLRVICKSKIHHAVVTGADLHYVGSIGIDRALMKRTDIVSGEQVSVWNVNNGQRIETYAIELPGRLGTDRRQRRGGQTLSRRGHGYHRGVLSDRRGR